MRAFSRSIYEFIFHKRTQQSRQCAQPRAQQRSAIDSTTVSTSTVIVSIGRAGGSVQMKGIAHSCDHDFCISLWYGKSVHLSRRAAGDLCACLRQAHRAPGFRRDDAKNRRPSGESGTAARAEAGASPRASRKRCSALKVSSELSPASDTVQLRHRVTAGWCQRRIRSSAESDCRTCRSRATRGCSARRARCRRRTRCRP